MRRFLAAASLGLTLICAVVPAGARMDVYAPQIETLGQRLRRVAAQADAVNPYLLPPLSGSAAPTITANLTSSPGGLTTVVPTFSGSTPDPHFRVLGGTPVIYSGEALAAAGASTGTNVAGSLVNGTVSATGLNNTDFSVEFQSDAPTLAMQMVGGCYVNIYVNHQLANPLVVGASNQATAPPLSSGNNGVNSWLEIDWTQGGTYTAATRRLARTYTIEFQNGCGTGLVAVDTTIDDTTTDSPTDNNVTAAFFGDSITVGPSSSGSANSMGWTYGNVACAMLGWRNCMYSGLSGGGWTQPGGVSGNPTLLQRLQNYGDLTFVTPQVITLQGSTNDMSPGATFTASISAGVLNVTAVSSGNNIAVGQTLFDASNLPTGGSAVTITSLGTGTGGTGTYNVSNSSISVGSETMASVNLSALQTAASSGYTTTRAAYPSAVIIFTGQPYCPIVTSSCPTNFASEQLAMDNALLAVFNASAKYPNTLDFWLSMQAPPSGIAPWITGNSNVSHTNGDGNSEVYIQSGPHPTTGINWPENDGYPYYGFRYADFVRNYVLPKVP